jgi:hypothetical protein
MKKWTSFLAVFVAVAMLAPAVYAQGTGGAGGPATSGSPATGQDRAKGETPPGTPGSTSTGATRNPDSSPSASPGTTGTTGTMGSTSGTTSSSSSMASADFTGRHTMQGEVTKVDQRKGSLTLKTAEGNLDLHFPPSALQNVKKGDRISVELAMKPAGSASLGGSSPAASPRTDKDHSMKGNRSDKK